MNTEIEQYERIQEYLLGRMSDEERTAFERELATDDSLRKQCDDLRLLARSIVRANQEADLRLALEKIEKELAESSIAIQDESAIDEELSRVEQELKIMGASVEEHKPSVSQVLKDRVKGALGTVWQWFIPTGYLSTGSSRTFSLSYVSRLAISFAVAASLALAISLPYNANIASSGYNYAPSHIELQTYRGSSSDMLEKAVNSYNNGDYALAFSYLDEAKNNVESTLAQLGNSDSDIIAKQELNNQLYQIEWYRALVLMKDKRVRDAKRALRAISESNSPYAGDALYILESVY